MKNFELIITDAGNGYFAAIYCKETGKNFEFCGTLPQVGNWVGIITTQHFGSDYVTI